MNKTPRKTTRKPPRKTAKPWPVIKSRAELASEVLAYARRARSAERELKRREQDDAIEAAKVPQAPQFDDVMCAARRWHYTEVREIATCAIEELTTERKGNTRAMAVLVPNRLTAEEARERLDTWVRQHCDGHQHVIYVGHAMMLLAASDNCDAYADETGEATKDVSVAACAALVADVWQVLENRASEWDYDDEEPSDDTASPAA